MKMLCRYFLPYHYKTLRNGALAPTECFASKQRWKVSSLIVSGMVRPGFTSAFSQRSEWLTIERHFATALSRLLNALQASNSQGIPDGAKLATLLLASQARSVSEVNGLLLILHRFIRDKPCFTLIYVDITQQRGL